MLEENDGVILNYHGKSGIMPKKGWVREMPLKVDKNQKGRRLI